MFGGLGHAAPVHHGEKNVEIAQLQAPAYTTLPVLDGAIHHDS
jgi:hypothetical protein